MWAPTTYWVDLSLYFALLTVGGICFGRFEDWKPRWRRLLKTLTFTALFIGLLFIGGRPLAWGFLGAVLLAAAWIHLVWLPRQGIDGWTGEPREKYLELVGSRQRGAGR